MAIRVICPGCMTSFEVDDRFAGKKGPCPKCGHIIEIPKEKIVIHGSDDVTSNGKTKPGRGQDARPILQRRFVYTGKQVFWGVMGSLGAIAAAFLVGAAGSAMFSAIVGAIAVFLIAFPISEVGYMFIRDENDLEIFLGNERHIRAAKAAAVFGASWLVFEAFVHFLGGTGLMSCVYLLVIGAIGAIGALIFFDCNYGKALLVYSMFAIAAIFGRGLLFQWNGWIWQSHQRAAAMAPEVKLSTTRMNGATSGITDEEIVDVKMAIKAEADERKAAQKAKNKNAKSAASDKDAEQEEDVQKKRSRMRRR